MDSETHSGPGISIPPPFFYLVALVAGIGLNYVWPLAPLPAVWGYAIGGVLILLSFALIIPAIGRFRKAGTPFDVRKPATALVVDGPYRFSRNPGYVALTLLYLGVGIAINYGWVLLLAAPVLFIMDRWIIRKEEAHLQEAYGDDYTHYKQAVRRWL